jgi:hypothetical protein
MSSSFLRDAFSSRNISTICPGSGVVEVNVEYVQSFVVLSMLFDFCLMTAACSADFNFLACVFNSVAE